jgi:1-acyl-sn-glycerol-3-phosphate acyltransferase
MTATMRAVGELTDPRDRKRYYFEKPLAGHVITAVIKMCFDLLAERHVQGVENLPATGPAILIANHMTNFDVIPMQLGVPRTIFFMGKEELFRNPALDWGFRQLGGFPVCRGAGDEWAMNHAKKVLQHGQVLGIFPEGTRSKGKGLARARSGAARLALACNVPIVPMGLHGTQYMFRNFPRRTPVWARLGAPIYPHPDETPQELTQRMMEALAALLPVESRGVYG